VSHRRAGTPGTNGERSDPQGSEVEAPLAKDGLAFDFGSRYAGFGRLSPGRYSTLRSGTYHTFEATQVAMAEMPATASVPPHRQMATAMIG
jgi:hypothetical protein